MTDPYVGQIVCVPYNFVPEGWALCNGQLLPIDGNEALFQLISTTYGGNGVDNFALPDLRGRIPLGSGAGGGGNYSPGEKAGVEVVWMAAEHVPAHTHVAVAGNGPAGATSPAGAFLSPASSGAPGFAAAGDGSLMNAAMVAPTPAATAGHNNLQPYLVINWIISLGGDFPGPVPPGSAYLGELLLVPWSAKARGWIPCEGQLLSTASYPLLFARMGTTYGGDGRANFGLPDLRGLVPVSAGPGYPLGQRGGTPTVALQSNQAPPHSHAVNVAGVAASDPFPANNLLATAPGANYQTSASAVAPMNAQVVQPAGGAPHENRMPSLALEWSIAITGAPAPVDKWTGEMMLLPYGATPDGWLPCEGQVLPIAQYRNLYSVVGNAFGGDGRTTFGLPDLRGRVPMGAGQGPGLSPRELGEQGGAAQHTLVSAEMPAHSHGFQCDTQGATQASPVGGVPSVPSTPLYAPPAAIQQAAKMLSPFGAAGPHENMQPYVTLQWMISTTGPMPQRQPSSCS